MDSPRFFPPVATLVLRVVALSLLVASIALIATAKVNDPFEFDFELNPPNKTFQDYYAYRYALSVGAIGCVYTLLAMAFVAINVARRKMIGGSAGGTALLICADVVCTVLVATGAAAGLGFTVDTQRFDSLYYLDSQFETSYMKFHDRFNVSCAMPLLASVCMVAIVMISVYSLTK